MEVEVDLEKMSERCLKKINQHQQIIEMNIYYYRAIRRLIDWRDKCKKSKK